jgi:hypothetical protein
MTNQKSPPPDATFKQVLAAAIEDMGATGYVSEERLLNWVTLLRNAAERELGPDYAINEDVKQGFTKIYERFVNGASLGKRVEGLSRFTLENVKPRLRAELDRRVEAAANLIKLNKKEAVERTLRRFQGWSTSIPAGGSSAIDKREIDRALAKDLKDYRYHRRLVDNDQGHKLISNVADLTAEASGAIAGIWNSHGTSDPSYNAREDHKERAGKIYLIRNSWAHKQGLVKPVHGYLDEITAAGEEVNCRCWITYITSPARLPDAYLTNKGQDFVAAARRMVA